MAAGDNNPKGKRASKTTTTTSNSIFDVNKLERMIEKAKNGESSKSKEINEKNLKRYQKQLESIKSGTATGTKDPGENKNSKGADTGAGGSLSAGLLPNVLHKFASYTTLFTLSGVNERELHDHTFLQNPVHDVIARSSGIGADINQSGSGIRTEINPNQIEDPIYDFRPGVTIQLPKPANITRDLGV